MRERGLFDVLYNQLRTEIGVFGEKVERPFVWRFDFDSQIFVRGYDSGFIQDDIDISAEHLAGIGYFAYYLSGCRTGIVGNFVFNPSGIIHKSDILNSLGKIGNPQIQFGRNYLFTDQTCYIKFHKYLLDKISVNSQDRQSAKVHIWPSFVNSGVCNGIESKFGNYTGCTGRRCQGNGRINRRSGYQNRS